MQRMSTLQSLENGGGRSKALDPRRNLLEIFLQLVPLGRRLRAQHILVALLLQGGLKLDSDLPDGLGLDGELSKGLGRGNAELSIKCREFVCQAFGRSVPLFEICNSNARLARVRNGCPEDSGELLLQFVGV